MDEHYGISHRAETLREDLLTLIEGTDMTSLGTAQRGELKLDLIQVLQDLIDVLLAMTSSKDMASVLATEKEFLSEKVPEDVANKIGSYLSGKPGSLGAQKSQLRTQVGISGVPSQGGRKTRRRRTRRV
jgi:hypothetical protein